MLVAVVAMVFLVFAALELATLPAWLVLVTSEAVAVTGSVTGVAWRPRCRRVFAVAEDPLGWNAAADPAVLAGMRIDVPRRRFRPWALRLAVFFE